MTDGTNETRSAKIGVFGGSGFYMLREGDGR